MARGVTTAAPPGHAVPVAPRLLRMPPLLYIIIVLVGPRAAAVRRERGRAPGVPSVARGVAAAAAPGNAVPVTARLLRMPPLLYIIIIVLLLIAVRMRSPARYRRVRVEWPLRRAAERRAIVRPPPIPPTRVALWHRAAPLPRAAGRALRARGRRPEPRSRAALPSRSSRRRRPSVGASVRAPTERRRVDLSSHALILIDGERDRGKVGRHSIIGRLSS